MGKRPNKEPDPKARQVYQGGNQRRRVKRVSAAVSTARGEWLLFCAKQSQTVRTSAWDR